MQMRWIRPVRIGEPRGMILANTDDKYIHMVWTPRERKRKRKREQRLRISRLRIESPKRERGNGMFLTSLCFHERCLTISLTCYANNDNIARQLPGISPHFILHFTTTISSISLIFSIFITSRRKV